MNSPNKNEQSAVAEVSDNNAINTSISLDDKYTLERGRAFMTGTQALIRLTMLISIMIMAMNYFLANC